MLTTSPSLLQRLREPNQGPAWQRFVDLYTPLLLAWARRLGLRDADAADLVQEVFAVLVQQLPKFQYDPVKKNFRGWLRTVCFNKWRDLQRKKGTHEVQADSEELSNLQDSDGLNEFWDREHHRFLVRQALETLKELHGEFTPQTIEACWGVVVEQRPSALRRMPSTSPNCAYSGVCARNWPSFWSDDLHVKDACHRPRNHSGTPFSKGMRP